MMVLADIMDLMLDAGCPAFQLSTVEGRNLRSVYKHNPPVLREEPDPDAKADTKKKLDEAQRKKQLEEALAKLKFQVEILDRSSPGIVFSIIYSPSVNSWGTTVSGPFEFTLKEADPAAPAQPAQPYNPYPYQQPYQQQGMALGGLGSPEVLGTLFNLNNDKSNLSAEKMLLAQQRDQLDQERRNFREEMQRERDRFDREKKEWREEQKEKYEEKARDLENRWKEKGEAQDKAARELRKRLEKEAQALKDSGNQFYHKAGRAAEGIMDKFLGDDEEDAASTAASAAGLAGVPQDQAMSYQLIQEFSQQLWEDGKNNPQVIAAMGVLLQGYKNGTITIPGQSDEED